MLMCAIMVDKPNWKAIFMMIVKKYLEKGIKNKVFGCFFAIFLMLSGLFGAIPGTINNVYAEPEEETPAAEEEKADGSADMNATCKDSLGSLGWLVCPTTEKISHATDFLYDKIEDILEINPVEAKDGSPVYEIWKYFQGATNVLFALFLLIVVLSQITGVGITNYGIKKTLPKLIIAAILVNLSFFICSLAVDVSNIFGGGIRGLFDSIAASASANIESSSIDAGVGLSEAYSAMAGGTALTIGGLAIAFETGAIWMLIPLVFGALVSVVIGLITIAMRQAVVTLLIMIAPIAMVAYILPNTEPWFKKWRHMLIQMIIFYPAFSLLFGASSVAGWAIIVSSQNNGFGVLIGMAVQIFPLFFSWSLMKMSGTILGTINSKLNSLASGAIGGVRGWATSHQTLSRQKHLASPNAYSPSMKLQQYLSDRKIAREEETREHTETIKNRGMYYAANRNYKNGIPTKEAEGAYEAQARNMRYQEGILRHKNNMNKGLGQLEALKENGTIAQKARINELDVDNVKASDNLKMEQARGERIDYKNAVGFHNRMEAAMNAHMDDLQSRGRLLNAQGNPVIDPEYVRHFASGSTEEKIASDRYNELSKIMEGNAQDAHYAAAVAAHAYDTQNKIMATKMQKYFELTPPTKDVMYRLDELTKVASTTENKIKAAENIDAIIAGLRVLNARGDTDLVKYEMDNILDKSIGGGIQLGTHASQALASFLMFEVKDSDPWLRRFGKYINLETAQVYNGDKRKNRDFDYEEYVRGYHTELNEETGQLEQVFAKKGMVELMEGTSLDNIERTALSNFDESLRKAYTSYENGQANLNVKEYLERRKEVQTAIGPQFISASLKYLSGSEQLVSAVKFLTGYKKKTGVETYVGEDGKEYSRAVAKWVPEWENLDNDTQDEMKKFFEKQTLDYIAAQTPSQILGLRSDYKDPLFGHLADSYMEPEDIEEWDEDAILERENYMREWSDIQTRYGDLPNDEAKTKRDKDEKDLRKRMAGAQLRRILDGKGKLNQIYRTRRSGAANNAKDWVRELLDLDNEVVITAKLENDRRKLREEYDRAKKEKAQNQKDGDTVDDNSSRIYTTDEMNDFVTHVEQLWDELKNEDDEVFYRESLKYIRKEIGGGSFIAIQYRKYREDDPYADGETLRDYLEGLLNNPDNY